MAKSASFGGVSAQQQERPYNAETMASIQEARDIMSGKKRAEWHSFQPGATKSETKEELKKILGL